MLFRLSWAYPKSANKCKRNFLNYSVVFKRENKGITEQVTSYMKHNKASLTPNGIAGTFLKIKLSLFKNLTPNFSRSKYQL